MDTLHFDRSRNDGAFKPLNATNGGPWHRRHCEDQPHSNFQDYKAARIPYSRCHDSGVCGIYGGPYSYDITCIFPHFEADPCDPASYDFACTDEAVLVCLDAGTETFFRLGQTIEHQIRKHGTLPPADFQKWAVICEHIIRHYNEGWADGYRLNIQYWEIWNEPDLDEDDSPNKRTWGGTKAEFFDLYETAARHLKGCFPQLKIGGPALAWREDWAADFIQAMAQRHAPLDFFSWHIYATSPAPMAGKAQRIRALLDGCGFTQTESILNEWNYVAGWTDKYIRSLETIHGIKGAAFTMACICEMQHAPVDMLMYYDTRPSVFNGVFDFYTCRRLKGYYPLAWYGLFYDCEREIRPDSLPENIYALCGADQSGKVTALVAYYTNDDQAPNREVTLDLGGEGEWSVSQLDAAHDAPWQQTLPASALTFTLAPQTILLLQEK